MNCVVPPDKFLFSRLIVHGQKVPILVLQNHLVALPSRFALYLVERKNLSFTKASKHLKSLAQFIAYLSEKNLPGSPDHLLLSVSNSEIERFLNAGGSKSKNLSLRLLMFDFYTWLEREEGITLSEITFKYP